MATTTRKVDAKGRVILPEQFAGQVVSLTTVGDEVRIRVARQPRRRPSLDSLMARVTELNLPEKVDFGPPLGDEQL